MQWQHFSFSKLAAHQTYLFPTSLLYHLRLLLYKVFVCKYGPGSFAQRHFHSSAADINVCNRAGIFLKDRSSFSTFTASFYPSHYTDLIFSKILCIIPIYVEAMIRPDQASTQWRVTVVASYYVHYTTTRAEQLHSKPLTDNKFRSIIRALPLQQRCDRSRTQCSISDTHSTGLRL